LSLREELSMRRPVTPTGWVTRRCTIKLISYLYLWLHKWETHKLIALRFWVKVWCLPHLCGCFYVVGHPDSSRDSLVISMARFDKGFDQAPCIGSFLGKLFRRRLLLRETVMVQASVYGWKSFRLRGEHDELMDSYLTIKIVVTSVS